MQYKSDMYKDSCLWIVVKNSVTYFIQTDDSLKMLDKFSDWCFTKEQEVQEFKTWFLNPSEPCSSICTNLLLENQFELADKIIA